MSAATFRRSGKLDQARGAIQEAEVRDEENPNVWVQVRQKVRCPARLDIEHQIIVGIVPHCAWEQGSGSAGIQQGALHLPG